MNSAAYLLAPLALLLPAQGTVQPVAPAGAGLVVQGPLSLPTAALDDELAAAAAESFRIPDAQQVRIEQRVTIRISPRAAPIPVLPTTLTDSAEFDEGPRMIERKMGKCLALSGIAGVQPARKNKLVLMLRDGRYVSATLDKSCRARDFYSGFLVARNADGMLCTGRDELLSRSGANCKLSGFKQLVEVDD